MVNEDVSYQFLAKSLRRLMTRYGGQYVAIVGRSIVAHGEDGKMVYDIAQKKFPHQKVLLSQIPFKEAMVLWVARVLSEASEISLLGSIR
jgi:hypothetical protein